MAFASGSGFGQAQNNQSNIFGKPAGSTFGAQSTFGQPATQQQQPTGGLFGQPAQQTQQSTGGLFGQPSTQATGGTTAPASSPFAPAGQQTQPTGGLFGQTSSQPVAGASTTQQPTGGSLFGQSTTPAGGGLFNQSTTQPPSGGGGLFGSSTTQPATSGGLFGQPTTQPAGGGVFGQFTAQPAAGSGVFGQSTTQSTAQPAAGGSLFGQSTTQPSGSGLFGSSVAQTQPIGGLFGSNQPQQSQVSTGPLLAKSTKFNDLPDEVKRTLEGIDSYIQGRLQISKDLHQRKLGEEPLKAQELLQGIRKDLMNIEAQTRDDHHLARDIKSKVDQAVQDAIVAMRLVDTFKNHQGGGASYMNSHANFPLEFFTRITENMRNRLVWYKSTIEQIERKLSSSTGQVQTPQGISATLQAQHATFLSLASKTAALDAEFQKIKAFVTQLYRAKTGSVRDPFSELDRTSGTAEFGIHSLGIK